MGEKADVRKVESEFFLNSFVIRIQSRALSWEGVLSG